MEKIVKEIINNKVGTKWQIVEQEKYGYTIKYYECYSGFWKCLNKTTNNSKEVIEDMFGKIF